MTASQDQGPAGHGVAGWLLRLPHVAARYRRTPGGAGASTSTVVWGPLVDAKEFPENVDVTLVEGAVSSEEDLHRIRLVRARTKILVTLGDCAVTGNVPAMRNNFGANAVLKRAYLENATLDAQIPRQVIPPLLAIVRPVHEFVPVDVFVPGCPPPADLIFSVLSDLLEGKMPNPAAKFG